jgi:predicted secreted Zn-dependent protease
VTAFFYGPGFESPEKGMEFGLMKGFSACFMAVAIAVSAVAGEGGGVVATVDANPALKSANRVNSPVVKQTYKYYDIMGCCEKDLQCDLKDKCIRMPDGKKYDSVTRVKMKWDYGHVRTPQSCTTESFVVTVDVVFNLPKWMRTGEAPPALVEKWKNYSEKLMLHEQGHRDRAVEAANEFTRTVAGLPPAPTCAALDREIQDLYNARLDTLMKEQDKYDDVTKHGATQGVVFP